MDVVFIPNPMAADVLQSLMRPGVEVCGPDQLVDSIGITNIYVLTPASRLSLQDMQSVNQRVHGRLAPSATITVVTF